MNCLFAIPFSLALTLAQPANASPVNDNCGTAEPISITTSCWAILNGLEVSDADLVDHYRGSIAPGHEARLRIRFDHPDGNIDVRLWNSDCTVLLASSASTTNDELVTWVNPGQVDADIVCEVYLNGTGTVPYKIYRCQELVDCSAPDDWEDNDTCFTPKVLPFDDYLYKTGRTVQQGDDDYYEITLPPFARLDFHVQHDPSAGNIDAALYESACGNLLQTSATMESEVLNLTNPTAVPRTLIAHIYMAGGDPCAIYKVLLSGDPGTNYCTSSLNSTGSAPVISAHGSASLAAGSISFSSGPLPWNVPGVFFYGPNAGNVPFGNGTLCVAGSLVRSPVVTSFKGSTFWNMNYFVQASSNNPITPGSIYRFQLWYRDPAGGGALFNLTDAYLLAFYP